MSDESEGFIATAEYVRKVRDRYQGDAEGNVVVTLNGDVIKLPYAWCVQAGFVIHDVIRNPRLAGSMHMLHIDYGDVRVEYPIWWPDRDWYIKQAEVELLAKESKQ